MGLSRTVSEIALTAISVENHQKFSHPGNLRPLLKEFALEFGTGARDPEKLE